MICDYFRATGSYDAAQGVSDLAIMCLHDVDREDFGTRRNELLLSASEIPQEISWKFGSKLNIRGSAQLQTVLALYDQQID